MKSLIIAFAVSAFVACVAQNDPTGTDTSKIDQAFACLSNADCPPNEVCGQDSEGHAVSTVPQQCASDNQCPAHERCNTVCLSTGGTRHVCQPDGLPTHVCP